ncbi:YgjV family protein [Evansella tamaricis]|uniref:YgjV family protein n=1 Tax=Evansella tamaricis TaxID=2069301 RepID=UPI001FEA2A70|nr:YgjV family protein [Evansella tamaricis]
MTIHWLEWLGYLASLIVLISLLMSSIIKLRWINLIGSSVFSLYGFLIGALPVGLMNMGIALINIYYLIRIYQSKEYFKLLPLEDNSEYLSQFLKFYKKEITAFGFTPDLDSKESDIRFFILRNMVPAGVYLASKQDKHTLKVDLDFVTPEYRDFKTGKYIYEDCIDYFLHKGYSKFISYTTNKEHINYLKTIGFTEKKGNDSNTVFVKNLREINNTSKKEGI